VTVRGRFATGLLALALLAGAGACDRRSGGGNVDLWNGSTIKQAKDRGKLVVLMEAGFKPFTYKEAGVLQGFDVDLSREIAKDLGVEVEFRERAWDMLAAELVASQGDLIVSGVTTTPKRALECSFTDPYFLTRTITLLSVPRADGVRALRDLDDERHLVVAQKASTGETAVKRHLPKARLATFDTEDDCVLQITQGRADAFVYDEFQVRAAAKANPGSTRLIDETLSIEPYAIEIRKGDPESLDWLNLVLSLMKRDGRLAALYEKHLPGVKPFW
jgi:polar amino acid transport system substrate-binding protein